MAERGESTSLWAGLAVGLGIMTVIGLVGIVAYLFTRKDRSNPATAFGYPNHPQLAGGSLSGSTALPRLTPAQPSRPRSQRQQSMRTVTLPGPTGTPVRVATSGDMLYEVRLRTITPPGSFAFASFDPTELQFVTSFATAAGNIIAVPVSVEPYVIRLAPGQALYAKGSTDGVRLTVTAIDFPA